MLFSVGLQLHCCLVKAAFYLCLKQRGGYPQRLAEGASGKLNLQSVKAEGKQEERTDQLQFTIQRSDERAKCEPNIDPSVSLAKWVEEIVYTLSDKRTGVRVFVVASADR